MEYRECERCPGYCCMSNGTLSTPLTIEDIARIANHLRIPIEDFVHNFVKVTPRAFYTNVPNAQACFKTTGPCPFLRGGLCGVNKVKPEACRDEKPMPFGEITCAEWHKARVGWI